MIIGIDASRANHEQKTGVEWYAWHIIQEVKNLKSKVKSGGDLHFILYSDKPLRGELAELPPNWESRALRWPIGRFWTQIRLSWEMLLCPPDVLFIPAHVFPIIHPKKTVMTVHDIAAARFPEAYSRFERWYSLFSAMFAVNKLWKVIVPSEFTKTELLKMSNVKAQMSNVSVAPHGYDTRYRKIYDTATIDRVLQKYGIRKPFLLSVGRLEEKKNTARIVEAFSQLYRILEFGVRSSELQLVLVGSPGHGYEKVKEAIDQSPHNDRILTPGWIALEDLVYIMNAASVFVFPSLYEGFGLPILEAMACGAPVVCGKGGSLSEVGGEAAVYADPFDVSDIVRGIITSLQHSSARDEKIKQGLQRAAEFSWEKSAKKTLDMLLNG